MRRWLMVALGLGAISVFAAWWGVSALDERRYQASLREAKAALSAQRYAHAHESLSLMSSRWPGRGEVELLLGSCAKLLGHPDAAIAAWQRVPERSPEKPVASLSLGRLALERGQYSLAEQALQRAARGPSEVSTEATRELARIDYFCGKLEEYRKTLHTWADQARDPSSTLRILWWLDAAGYPIDGMRRQNEQARRNAPDDDRVWLASADIATRSGHFDEASKWLDRCEKARPDEPAIWRARLRWAVATDRPDEAERAATHLSASAISRTAFLELQAWFCSRAGQPRAEKAALETFLRFVPGDAPALVRLAELTAREGPVEKVAEVRRKKAEVEVARDEYRFLLERNDLLDQAAKLAPLAESLGRWFEASCWWSAAARQARTSQGSDQARVRARETRARFAQADAPTGPSNQRLADLLSPFRPPGGWKIAGPVHPLALPAFRDDAASSGLDFTFLNGRSSARHLPETFCGGIGLIDYDGDGFLDVYAVQCGTFPPPEGISPFGDRLFHNLGNGHFEDVTERAGLAAFPGGFGMGVAVGDYDNDGHPDLFVTRWKSYALYHNKGDGTFEDVTDRAGLGGDRDWPTSAAWADLDGDGDLDLYVDHYLVWDAINPMPCHDPSRPEGMYCHPRMLPALPDHVFRNDGGHFVDVTEQAGMTEHDGRGLGVLAADLDDDGKVDLLVSNDTSPNYFYHNQGNFRFVEEGLESGLATNSAGGYLAGMGITCGDFDRDGRIDAVVTNFFGESTTLYRNLGNGLFSDSSTVSGLAAATRFKLGFGVAAVDVNNDGWLDLLQVNGHINDYRPTVPYEMPPQVFLGNASGRFTDVSEQAGPCWKAPHVARGLAAGDIDNDGLIDAVFVCENEPLGFFRNTTAEAGHFLTIALEGTKSNRDAIGAKVTVTAGGQTWISTRFGGGSYLSAGDPRLHFGLGSIRVIDHVEVIWPSRHVDRYEGLAIDSGYRFVEGDAAPKRLPGFGRK